jgi:hypothetical protein
MSSRRAVFDWLRRVMADGSLTSATKTVAWSLAEHANSNAVAWPKVEAVGTSVGLDISNARRHISTLRTAAYLVVEDRRHMREPSWYWLAVGGHVLGDFNAPPKPRATTQSRAVETELETAPESGLRTLESDHASLRGRDEGSDHATPRGGRPRNSACHDHATPPATTTQGCAVTPSYSPKEPPKEHTQRARASPQDVLTGPETDTEPRIRGALVAGYQRRYEQAYGAAWLSASKSAADLDVVARWCGSEPDPPAAVEAVLDGAFADPWLTTGGRRVPLGAVAKDPAKFAAAGIGTAAQRRGKRMADLRRALEKARERGDDTAAAELQAELDGLLWGAQPSASGVPPNAGHSDESHRARQGDSGVIRRIGRALG